MFLMVSRVRPSSTDSCTGMSMIMSMSLLPSMESLTRGWKTCAAASAPAAGLLAAALVGATAEAVCSASALAQSSAPCARPSAWVGWRLAPACSAKAAPQSISGLSVASVSGLSFSLALSGLGSVMRICSGNIGFRGRQYFLDAQGVPAVERSVAAFHHGNAANVGSDGGRNFQRQDIVDFQAHQLADGAVDTCELGNQLDIGATYLARQLIRPALIDGARPGFLQRARQQIAHRLYHGVGQADVQIAAAGAKFDIERGHHHDLIAAGNAGELGVHFRTYVLELNRIHLLPAACIAFQRQVQQSFDDALLGCSEVAAFHTGAIATMTAKHAVNNQEHQVGIKREQCGATQGLHRHHVQVAGYRQIPFEVGILLDAYGPYRDVSVAAHEGQQYRTQAPGESLVDELQGLHAVAHHPVGRA